MTREQAIMTLIVVDENATCDDCLYYNQMEDCPNDEDCIIRQAFDMSIKALEQEPKTGHWISMNTGKPSRLKDGMTTESVKCSECDEWLTSSDEYACNGNYCPNCGARMEVDEC